MIGLVLVAHGALAEEFVSALEHVVGPQLQCKAVCIRADDNVEMRRDDLLSCIECVDTGDGVILLTDMFGGTPSNLAISAMKPGRVEVLAGMNLPMLVKIASIRDEQPIQEVLIEAQHSGRKYIHVASHVLAAE